MQQHIHTNNIRPTIERSSSFYYSRPRSSFSPRFSFPTPLFLFFALFLLSSSSSSPYSLHSSSSSSFSITVLSVSAQSSSYNSFAAPSFPPSCPAKNRFDISSLSCVLCSSDSIDATSGTLEITSTTNIEKCQCPPGYSETVAVGDIYQIGCTICPTNTAALRDRSACVPCGLNYTEGFNPVTKECACPPGFIICKT